VPITIELDPFEPEVQLSEAAAGWTEATRLMCAAAYVDPTFANEVIEEIVEEDFRAMHAPPGVDVGCVVRHCLAARQRHYARDVALAALGAILVVLVLLASGYLVSLVWLGLLIAWAIVALDMWTGTYQVVAKALHPRTFSPADAPPVSDPVLGPRAVELAERQGGNVTVYSGFGPFAGSGFEIDGWSFVIDLRRGKDDVGTRRRPTSVGVTELYDTLERSLRGLGRRNLTIEDRLYVHGTDIREDRELLPAVVGRPVSRVPGNVIQRYLAHPTQRVRHYKCVRVVDWGGELVLSLFVRCSIHNGRLFCETSAFLLTPLTQRFHHIDGVHAQAGAKVVLALARRALRATPGLWLRSPATFVRPFGRMRRHARARRQAERDPLFDYGAPSTVLERARSQHYARYFQRLDKEMYGKLLERTILDAIVEVLDAHDVDTSELADRRSTIINHGLMVGGSVKAENVAVGVGASILNRMRPGATGKGEGK
jgi:hypothetical protein